MSFKFLFRKNTNSFLALTLIVTLILSQIFTGLDSLFARTVRDTTPTDTTLAIGIVGLKNAIKPQTVPLTYKSRITAIKNTKKPISFVEGMRTIRSKSSINTASTVSKLVVNTTPQTIKKPSILQSIQPESKNMILTNFYAQRKLVSTKPKGNTSITTVIPVLNSAPVAPAPSGGGGGSSSTPVVAPTTPTAPVATVPVPVVPAPVAPVPVVPAPVAPAPVAPAPVATVPAPVVPAPVAPAPVAPAPVVPAPTTPVATVPAPVVPAPTAPVATVPAPVVPAPVVPAPTAPAPVTPVSPTNSPINIVNPQNPQLKKLLDYQRVTGKFVSDHLMIFMTMPQSAATIEGTSYYMANIANEFALYNITPIFVFEPIGDYGVQLDLGRLRNGDYSANLELLFSMLKNNRNIPESKIGMIVPYPEINTPAFNRANFVPENLPTMVNIFFDSIKKFYPNVQGGLLLDSKSYDIGKSWGQGGYTSFAPYLMGIKYGHIQTFGIQGFPWASNDASIKVYDPAVFIPNNLTEEAANILGIKKVWFNTGTMKRQYQTSTVNVTTAERTATLNGIVNQADLLQAKGFTTLIHIFAQDKFAMGEGIDWSYLENANDGVLSPHEAVFKSFLEKTQAKGIKIGLFDL